MNKIFGFPVRLNRHQQTAEKQKSVSMQFVSNYKRKLIRNGKWKSNNEATRWGKKLKNSIRYFCNLITRFHHQNEIKSHFSLFIAFNYKKLPVKLDCLSVWKPERFPKNCLLEFADFFFGCRFENKEKQKPYTHSPQLSFRNSAIPLLWILMQKSEAESITKSTTKIMSAGIIKEKISLFSLCFACLWFTHSFSHISHFLPFSYAVWFLLSFRR